MYKILCRYLAWLQSYRPKGFAKSYILTMLVPKVFSFGKNFLSNCPEFLCVYSIINRQQLLLLEFWSLPIY